MSTDVKPSNDRNPAAGLDARGVAPLKTRRELSLELTPHKPLGEQRSSDPYNTSGSFDRTKNWARVGKR
jgi:hypothetical protein